MTPEQMREAAAKVCEARAKGMLSIIGFPVSLFFQSEIIQRDRAKQWEEAAAAIRAIEITGERTECKHGTPFRYACEHCDSDALNDSHPRRKENEMTNEGVTVLPDGSAFAVASYPLPANHWPTAPRVYEVGRDDDVPPPALTNDQRHAVSVAVKWATRGATDCGKLQDFDPDALVQNAVYALCGPYGLTNAARGTK